MISFSYIKNNKKQLEIVIDGR